MIRKWKLLLVGVSCVMGTAMAQNNPILLFPKGAPGETTKLIEKADADGEDRRRDGSSYHECK